MNSSTLSRRVLSASLGLFAVSIGLYAGGLYVISDLRLTLEETRLRVQDLTSRTGAAQRAQSLVDQYSTMHNELIAQLVPTDDPAELLELIELLAQDANVVVEIDSVSAETRKLADEPEDSPGRPVIAVSIAVEGGWGNVYRFVTFIESLPYASTISLLRLEREERGSPSSWSGQLGIEIEARSAFTS